MRTWSLVLVPEGLLLRCDKDRSRQRCCCFLYDHALQEFGRALARLLVVT